MSDNYYVMLHDEMRCIGCQACTVACANLNDVPHPYARVQVQMTLQDNNRYKMERFSCRHCGDAPCVKVCPTGATYQDEDQIVVIDPEKCINCSYCMGACPYHVRFLSENTKVADKCNFCKETRLANGEAPACVSVCPTDALAFGRMNSPEVQKWLADHKNVYQDEKPNTGKLHMYRSKEVHNG